MVQHASVVITNDTGLMHIAAAFKKNIVSVWGNTVPDLGMSPYLPAGISQRSILIEAEGVRCRPCSKLGYSTCPKGHFRCMLSIPPEAITDAVGMLIDEKLKSGIPYK